MWQYVECVHVVNACLLQDAGTCHLTCFTPYLHLHMWEAEVKVTETKQAAFPLVTSAAAVTFCPGRFGSGSKSAHLLQSVIRPLDPGAPCPAHTTVLIRLIGLDLELPPVPVAPAPVTCGPC